MVLAVFATNESQIFRYHKRVVGIHLKISFMVLTFEIVAVIAPTTTYFYLIL